VATRGCRIPECPRGAAHHKTLCHAHRIRQWRHGDPTLTAATTPLDDIALDAAVRNRQAPTGLTLRERRATAILLTDRGLPASEIARILSVSPRTVHRWRAATRTTAAA
jgi:DNA-directed RNA polymerase specialized sigma24 family protein